MMRARDGTQYEGMNEVQGHTDNKVGGDRANDGVRV